MTGCFNLIREPWIRVTKQDYSTAKVSLAEVFANAHQYRALAGELPMQDTAMLRLLLLILYGVFMRCDPNGDFAPITRESGADIDCAEDRWAELWAMGRFPMESIEKYFEKYDDRFYLLHKERPFYQIANMAGGTEGGVNKLDAALDKSENKPRLFTMVNQGERTSLTYAAAARWLVNYVCHGDCSAKKPSPKQTWLGGMETVYVSGKNLFETLMLNLVLYDGEHNKLWPMADETELPLWERNDVNDEKNRLTLCPQSPMGMLAIQSRKVSLVANEKAGCVEGFIWGGGDCFEGVDALCEQMSAFATKPKEKNSFYPKRSGHAKFMWRDFGTLTITKNENGIRTRIPGVIRWQEEVRDFTGRRSVDIHMTQISYGTMNCNISRADSGELSFNNYLLGDLAQKWRIRIEAEVTKAEELSKLVGWLAKDLQTAGGAGISGEQAKERFFFAIDMPFRLWLAGIDPSENTSVDETMSRWRKTEERIVKAVGKELVDMAGETAFTGRVVKEKNGSKDVERLYCAPKSFNEFNARVAAALSK